jgi:hypothetical protein
VIIPDFAPVFTYSRLFVRQNDDEVTTLPGLLPGRMLARRAIEPFLGFQLHILARVLYAFVYLAQSLCPNSSRPFRLFFERSMWMAVHHAGEFSRRRWIIKDRPTARLVTNYLLHSHA